MTEFMSNYDMNCTQIIENTIKLFNCNLMGLTIIYNLEYQFKMQMQPMHHHHHPHIHPLSIVLFELPNVHSSSHVRGFE